MIVLGLDPGVKLGWARVELAHGKRPVVLSCGKSVCSSTGETDEVIGGLLDGTPIGAVIAIETLKGIAFPAKGASIVGSLIAAAKVEERVRVRCQDWTHRGCYDLTAGDWRVAVVGRRSPSDAQVAAALKLACANLPRTNEHARDAIGVAIAVAKCFPVVAQRLAVERRKQMVDDWNDTI